MKKFAIVLFLLGCQEKHAHRAKNAILFEHAVLEENAPQELMIKAQGLSLKNLKNGEVARLRWA